MASQPPRICIVGAGIAGLTLAQCLIKKGFQPIIYERDTSATARTQGGSLDLKADGGQIALKMAGLFEEFQKYMRKEGQDMKIMLPNGKILMHQANGDESDFNPEIDRGQLREILLDKLYRHIRWGSHVKFIEPIKSDEPSDHRKWKVVLAGGATDAFDLVVGADGCFSRIRSYLSDVNPTYTGYTFTECYVSNISRRYPDLSELIGRGMLMVPATGGKALIAQQNSDGKARIGAVLKVAEDWQKTNGFPWELDPKSTKRMLLSCYDTGDWTEELLDLIRLSDNSFRPWPLYALPNDYTWEHKTGLTLIGDAAHVMSPFAGEGANIAMLDGARLAEAIAAGVQEDPTGHSIDQKVEKFEQAMFQRASAAATESDGNMRQFLGGEADIEEVVAKWEKMMSGGPPK